MNLLESIPLNIKNLLMRLEKNENYNNNEVILSRFYSLNSDDQIINKIFEILKYDKILNIFKEPINIQKVKSIFLKEYCPEFSFKEEIRINPSQSSIVSQKSKDYHIIQNYIQTNNTPDLLKNNNFSQLLSNSLKNEYNNLTYVNNLNNSFQDNINDNNVINTDKKEYKNKNFILQKKRKKPLLKFKKVINEKQKLIIKNKNNYGLKEISNMVMNIIKREKQTSYKEISDEIVNNSNVIGIKDQKNIRRRIYDSLNVMKSIHLFSKEKKTKKIFWNGKKEFQNEIDYNDIYNINKEIEKFSNEISLKKETINNLLEQYKSINYIIERNKLMDHSIDENKKIYCPFIFFEIPNVEKDSSKKEIRVLMNENKNKIHIAFNSKLQLYGDLDAIKKLNNNLKI